MSYRTRVFASLASVLAALCADGKDVKWAATDPLKAGRDFSVQGEYVGPADTPGGRVKLGVQVIACGEEIAQRARAEAHTSCTDEHDLGLGHGSFLSRQKVEARS